MAFIANHWHSMPLNGK